LWLSLRLDAAHFACWWGWKLPDEFKLRFSHVWKFCWDLNQSPCSRVYGGVLFSVWHHCRILETAVRDVANYVFFIIWDCATLVSRQKSSRFNFIIRYEVRISAKLMISTFYLKGKLKQLYYESKEILIRAKCNISFEKCLSKFNHCNAAPCSSLDLVCSSNDIESINFRLLLPTNGNRFPSATLSAPNSIKIWASLVRGRANQTKILPSIHAIDGVIKPR